MRDMVAQCESNMNELQQLQVISPCLSFPRAASAETKGSTSSSGRPRCADSSLPYCSVCATLDKLYDPRRHASSKIALGWRR